MSDQEVQEDPSAPKELREYADRVKSENEQLKGEITDLKKGFRVSALRQNGIDPESTFGQTMLDAAEANGVNDPDDISAWVKVVRSEAQAGA